MLLLLIIAFLLFVQTPAGQNWLTRQVTKKLSRDLQTKISIKKVGFSFFDKMNLQGIMIEDRQKDTLLYAGRLRVNITDWFFFKDHIELKYMGLEDAVIKLQRSDSVWNYRFIQDYFVPASSGQKKKSGVEFNLKNIVLKNVLFLQKDNWNGKSMSVKVGALNLDTKEGNFSKRIIEVNSLNIVDPVFTFSNYPKKNPAPAIVVKEKETMPVNMDSLMQWNPAGWMIYVAKLDIKNGVFKNDKGSEAPLAQFDAKHVDFRKIDLHFDDLRWVSDTITAKINLKGVERSGFQIKSMQANLRVHPKLLELADFNLRTHNSVLKDRFVMQFSDFKDMSDFLHKVRLQANFAGADIDSDDIAFFVPTMKTWNKKIKISGKARGTVDDLKMQDMIVQAGGSTYLNGDISLSGLPDINQTFIDFKANNFKTTYSDAIVFAPALRKVTSPDIRKLQYINFTGSFTGFIRDFVTYGNIQTSLGTIKTDLNMKLPVNKDPVYSGNISTKNFKLGELLKSKDLGIVSFEGDIKGRGFNVNTLVADIDGTISQVEFNNYNYRNITAKGKLNKKLFDGVFAINDSNAIMHLNGVIDFNETRPKFNLLAEVQKANLQALKLTKDNLAFRGMFNLNFTGNNIDNFLGVARISEGTLLKDSTRLSFDSLVISSSYANGVKTLRAVSNEFDATITGDFNIQELPAAFTLFLNKYYPAYIKAPRRMPENENFSFDITTGYVDDYIRLFNKDLGGFNSSHIKGNLHLAQNIFNLEADVPQFSFKQYVFNNARIKGDGNFDRLVLTGDLDNVIIGDSLNLPQTNFHVEAKNDISNINITTSANHAINKANLAAQVQTYSDGIKVTFQPSTFVLNGKTWTIRENGELQLRTNSGASGELVLTESNQEIRINTVPSEEGNWNDIQVTAKKVSLGDLSPFIIKKGRIEGLVSGNINIENPGANMNVVANLEADQLRLDNDSIGQMQTSITYNNKTGILSGQGRNLDPVHKIDFDLNLFLKDSARFKDNRISARLQTFQLKILERFLGTLFSDIQGYITGNLDVTGPFSSMNFVGKGKLQDAGLKVNFTQCFYKIDDTEIELKPTELNLGTLKLRDRYGKTATVTGTLQHNSWKNMFFDINAKIDGEPFELLNTSLKDNKTFFGRAKGTGSLALLGPQSDIFMTIKAIASENEDDSSFITIRTNETRETGLANFLVERKYGREMTAADIKTNTTRITYDVDLTANPLVNVKFILDDLTGDEINGRGEGNLNIRAGTFEPLSMRGRFDIQEGNYTFTFQSFFKKPFILRPGAGNYISWSGDPLAAKVRLEAQYTAEDVNFAPLSSLLTPESKNRISRVRDDVYIIAVLTEDLFKPKIDFRLEFPSNLNADPSLAFDLQQILQLISRNQNELYKQATYLIVFNSFANVQSGSESLSGTSLTGALNEFAYSTLSGIFFNEINKQLNQILTKIFKNDNNLTFNLSGSLYNRNLINQTSNNNFSINQGNFNFTVGRSFFDDRFILTFGSGFDVPLTNNAQYNFQFLPDVTAEWIISKSGSVRATFFYRENLDYLTGGTTGGAGRTRRAGASIAYRKEFDSLDELLRRRNRNRPENVDTLPASTTTTNTNR